MGEFKVNQLVKIIEDICERYKEDGWKCERSNVGRYLEVTAPNGKILIIHGYKFDNNGTGGSELCDSKVALSDRFMRTGIPHVEHFKVVKPEGDNAFDNAISDEDVRKVVNNEDGKKIIELLDGTIWNELLKYYIKYTKFDKETGERVGGGLVLKANSGSGGKNVFLCRTMDEVVYATNELFKKKRSFIAVSPLIDIENEYRIIINHGEPCVIYCKQRPHIIGDGESTVEQLIEKNNLQDIELTNGLDLQRVPKAGEEVTISWKHNLGQGSLPITIKDKKLINKLANFALAAGENLGLNFASVDIVSYNDKTSSGKDMIKYKILEVNSGVMMEVYSKISEANYEDALQNYYRALCNSSGIKYPYADKYNKYHETAVLRKKKHEALIADRKRRSERKQVEANTKKEYAWAKSR